jgi:hypothetical protein
MLKSPSVVFNFNVDGLANRFCKNHVVINAHGTLDPKVFHSKKWDEMIEICLTYHLEPPKIPDVLLPYKEPIGITNKNQYKYARKFYPYTKYVVIIGYSFGFNGSSFDDWESYLFFIGLFKKHEKPIIIISPSGADQIAYMLGEKLLRNNIYVISAYWNYLATAMIESRRMRVMYPHIKENHKISLEYIYQAILDGMQSRLT